jgi:hypothetical protein
MIDDRLVQLGWYFRNPTRQLPAGPDGASGLALHVKGDDQPGVLVLEGEAQKLLPHIQVHFQCVLREAEPADEIYAFTGERKEELLEEWRRLRSRTASQ